MRRWLSLVLCLAMLSTLTSFTALADDTDLVSADVDAPVGEADDFGDTGLTLDDGSEGEIVPEEIVPEEVEIDLAPDGEAICDEATIVYGEVEGEEEVCSEAGISNEAAAAGFINRILYGSASDNQVTLRAANAAVGARFEGKDSRLYALLRDRIERVARGELTSSEFYFKVSEIYEEEVYTAEDLGLDTLVDEDGQMLSTVESKFRAKVAPNTVQVLNALLVDCPYDLYWFDKTGESTGGSGFGMKRTYEPYIFDGETIRLNMDGRVRFRFSVAKEYSATGETKTTNIDPSLPKAVSAAADNARTIVSKYRRMDDLSKMAAYRDEICGMVEYNRGAAAGEVVYGNPWQLVWVLDGDDTTDVVCEGYAKAFQYLCELSDFNEVTLSVVSVSGTLKGKADTAGDHMWNIVSMNGKNYLVDVTNCDKGKAGYPDKLFMKGYTSKITSGSKAEYCFEQCGYPLYYVFKNDMYNLFGEEELDYSDDEKGIQPTPAQSGTVGALTWQMDASGNLYISGIGAIPDFTEANPAPWGTEIVTATLAEGVTGIGARAFQGCAALEEATIPATATAFDATAFDGCAKLAGEEGCLIVACKAADARTWAAANVKNCQVRHGKVEILARVEPTCSQTGLTEGRRCKTCGDDTTPQEEIPATEEHPYGDWTTVEEATCVDVGSESRTCSVCGKVETREIPAKGHAPQTVKGYAATCATAGLSDGSRCSVCMAWITTQEPIPATGHKAMTVKGKAATCTQAGLTDGSQCSVCKQWITPQKSIPATGHTPVTVKGKAATCTQAGLTDGSKCSVCGVTLTAQQTIAKTAHTPVTVKGKAATCAATGLTDGTKCSVCGVTLTAQQTIAKKAHTPVTVKGYAATCTATGLTDGSKCSVCGVTLTAQQTIAKKAHTPVTVKGYAATYDRAGLTDGTKCSVCGAWITPQRAIAKLQYPTRVLDRKKSNGTVTVNLGDKIRLVPQFATAAGASVTGYKSGKAKVAAVDGSGLVTALAEGKAKITVTTNNKKVKATITVVVVDPYKPTGISIKQGKTLTMTLGQSQSLTAVLEPGSARSNLTWKTSKAKVVAVDGNGKLTALAEGKAKITVTTNNKKVKATITVVVVDPYKPTGISITQGKTITLKVGQSQKLGTTLEPGTARSERTWKSSKPAVATVDASGNVKALKKGKAKITVTTYNKKKATITVVVTE